MRHIGMIATVAEGRIDITAADQYLLSRGVDTGACA